MQLEVLLYQYQLLSDFFNFSIKVNYVYFFAMQNFRQQSAGCNVIKMEGYGFKVISFWDERGM
jgi:hypothetical protein